MSISQENIESPHVELRETNSAFGRRIEEFELVNKGYKNIEEFLLSSFELYKQKISEAVSKFNLIKAVAYFNGEFERSFHVDDESNTLVEKRKIHVATKVQEINSTTDLSEYFRNNIINYLVSKVDKVMLEGSGFTLSNIKVLRVQMFKYEPLRGSGFIQLPEALKGKRSILNLKNTYDECFKWSILAALHYKEVYNRNKNKVTDAASFSCWANELNFTGIEFPMQLNQIEKFMIQNERNEHIAIIVYFFDSEKNAFAHFFLQRQWVKKNTSI